MRCSRELIELCTGLLQRHGHVLPATRARATTTRRAARARAQPERIDRP